MSLLLEALVKILGGDDAQFRVYAAEIINNLTFKNETNKLAVCKAQGIPVIFHAIKNGAKDPNTGVVSSVVFLAGVTKAMFMLQ